MTYSACDFMDDILGVIDIPKEIESEIDPEDTAGWAEAAVTAIRKAQDDRAALLGAANYLLDNWGKNLTEAMQKLAVAAEHAMEDQQ